jgi:hypothetical protein
MKGVIALELQKKKLKVRVVDLLKGTVLVSFLLPSRGFCPCTPCQPALLRLHAGEGYPLRCDLDKGMQVSDNRDPHMPCHSSQGAKSASVPVCQ